MDLLEPSVTVEPPNMLQVFRMEFSHTPNHYNKDKRPKFIPNQYIQHHEEKINYFLPQKPTIMSKPDETQDQYKPTYATGHWSSKSYSYKILNKMIVQEHQAFLRGVKELGLGKWSEISKRFVKTRFEFCSHFFKIFFFF